MSKFEKVSYYYENGFWDISRVKNAVRKGWITESDFLKITGQKLTEGE